jgi:hypothetical protein
MKRFLLVGLAGLTAGACGFSSGLTTPSASSGTGTAVRTAQGVSCPSPSPTQLPFATFGAGRSVEQCGPPSSNPQLNPIFKINPNPAQGTLPFTVNFSMCGSSDTDPSVTLHYHVTHGDGSPDDGATNYCSFAYTYPNAGTYTATECVWDEIQAHAPGACQDFTVTVTPVAPACTVTFSNPFFCNSGSAAVSTAVQGGPSCGQPLTATASENGVVVGTAQTTCPPGATPSKGTCNLFFAPIPFESSFPAFVTVTGTNATGSITLSSGTDCPG